MPAKAIRTRTSHLLRRSVRKRKDRFTKAKRSEIMARIRSKNSRLDLAMKALLRKARLKFVMYPKIYGKPDFLVGRNLAVFCDSGFWHGRNWRRMRDRLEAGSNPSYWVSHIKQNRLRDRRVNGELNRLGYVVLRFWDEDISLHSERVLEKIIIATKESAS